MLHHLTATHANTSLCDFCLVMPCVGVTPTALLPAHRAGTLLHNLHPAGQAELQAAAAAGAKAAAAAAKAKATSEPASSPRRSLRSRKEKA